MFDAITVVALLFYLRIAIPLLALLVAFQLLLRAPQHRYQCHMQQRATAVILGCVVTTVDGKRGVVRHIDANRIIIEQPDGSKCQISPYDVSIAPHEQA